MSEPFVVITNTDIWVKLGTIENKVNELVAGQNLQNGRLATHDQWINENTRVIQGLNFKFYGVMAGFTAGLAYLFTNGGLP